LGPLVKAKLQSNPAIQVNPFYGNQESMCLAHLTWRWKQNQFPKPFLISKNSGQWKRP
jgi:hypothetical protein